MMGVMAKSTAKDFGPCPVRHPGEIVSRMRLGEKIGDCDVMNDAGERMLRTPTRHRRPLLYQNVDEYLRGGVKAIV